MATVANLILVSALFPNVMLWPESKIMSFYVPEEIMSHFINNVLVYEVVHDKCTFKVLFVENQKDFGNLFK